MPESLLTVGIGYSFPLSLSCKRLSGLVHTPRTDWKRDNFENHSEGCIF